MARLDVPQECQLGLNWCWAAASVAVARFYDKATTWTQCRIAAQVTNVPLGSCCTSDGPGDCAGGAGKALEACDRRSGAEEALVAMDHLEAPPVAFNLGLVDRIAQECTVRPVVVLVQTSAYPLGHYYVVCGVGAGGGLFEVVDPADQIGQLSLAALAASARQVCFTR